MGIRLVVRNTFSNDEGTEMSTIDSPIEGEIVSGIAACQNEAWIKLVVKTLRNLIWLKFLAY